MITTEEEYKKALKRVEEIWNFANEHSEEFNKLVNDIEEYEEIHYPMGKI